MSHDANSPISRCRPRLMLLMWTNISPVSPVTGCGQLTALRARRLGEGQSVDDRLREDRPPAGATDPGPQDSLGGGQPGRWLPVGPGPPHRHLQQHAAADTLNTPGERRKGGGPTDTARSGPHHLIHIIPFLLHLCNKWKLPKTKTMCHVWT